MKRSGKFYENKVLESALRFLAYCLLITALYALQSADFAARLFGEAPLVLVSFALCAAARENAVTSVTLGAVCGALMDVALRGEVGYFAFALTAACGAGQYILSRCMERNFLTAELFALAGCVCVIGGDFVISAANVGFAGAAELFFNIYLRRILYAAAASLPLYFAANALARR